MKKKFIKTDRKAEVTVFLTLLCFVICAFITALISSAKEISNKMKVEAVMDLAVKSAFAEFDKKLFDDYGLLYVDTTYRGAEDGGDMCFANHVSQYIDINLSQSHNNSGLSLMSVFVRNAVYADISQYDEAFCETIIEDIRENSNERFDFDKLLEAADITATFEDSSGRVYECTKTFSLTE